MSAAVLMLACRTEKAQTAGPPPAMPVTVATASIQSTPLEVRLVGTVEPSAKVEIKSQVAGQLMKVHFAEGQDVKQGDLLLDIDPQPYREALRQAEAAGGGGRAPPPPGENVLAKDIFQFNKADPEAETYAT